MPPASKPLVPPALWKVILIRCIMGIIGLFWSIFVVGKLLIATVRKGGRNFSTVERTGMCLQCALRR
jgi:hypothetical protein